MWGGGGYEGAETDRSATRNWTPGIGSPDSDIIPALEGIRARSRDLARNAPLIAGALDTQLTCIVGPGLSPHPRIDHEFLGLTEEQADKWQKMAARIWWTVAGKKKLDVSGRLNFAQMTRVVLRSWFTDGEHFFRRRHDVRYPGDLLDLKVQLIEADRVSNPDMKQDSESLVEGVELDPNGAVRGFHVQDRHPGDRLSFGRPTWSLQPAHGPETGELFMGQVWLPERAGQTRGISVFAPVIESVKQLTRYAGAELDATVASSFIMAVLETETGDEFESMGTGANPAPVGFVGNAASASQERQIVMAPAAVPILQRGEKLTPYNPQRPSSGFEPFFRAFCSIIGVAVGLPHELLIKHFTSSYSASRGALLEAWRTFREKRHLIVVDQWAQPVYEWVLYNAIDRGLLAAPGFFDDPMVRDAYCECAWTGPIMGQLNPRDEVEAAKSRVELTLSTLEEETAELTGGDTWERKVVQRGKEEQLRKKLGLTGETTAERIQVEDPDTASGSGGSTDPDKADEDELREAEENDERARGNAGAIASLASSVRALAERPPAPVHVSVAAPHVEVHEAPVTVTVEAKPGGTKTVTTPRGDTYTVTEDPS